MQEQQQQMHGSIGRVSLSHLEFFLQTIHLSSKGVNDVLPVFQHKGLQLLGRFHLLNVLQRKKPTPLSLSNMKANRIMIQLQLTKMWNHNDLT